MEYLNQMRQICVLAIRTIESQLNVSKGDLWVTCINQNHLGLLKISLKCRFLSTLHYRANLEAQN